MPELPEAETIARALNRALKRHPRREGRPRRSDELVLSELPEVAVRPYAANL